MDGARGHGNRHLSGNSIVSDHTYYDQVWPVHHCTGIATSERCVRYRVYADCYTSWRAGGRPMRKLHADAHGCARCCICRIGDFDDGMLEQIAAPAPLRHRWPMQ